jgi:peroxiredoxin
VKASSPTRTKQDVLSRRIGYGFLALIVIWIISRIAGGGLLDKGTPAPQWNLNRADGSGMRLSLAELRGKIVIIDFWSVTCPPCIRQIPELEAISRRLSTEGVAVIGIATGGESVDELEDFRKRKKISYTLLEGDGKTEDSYLVSSIPTLYIIDREGNIADSHRGYWDGESISDAVKKLIDE